MFLRVSTGEESLKIKFQNYFLLLFIFIDSLESKVPNISFHSLSASG